MLLYHLSSNIHHNGRFSPRIPAQRMAGEDHSIKRICVCDTLEGCFTAIPFGAGTLDVLQEETSGIYKVFVIDTEKLGIPDSDILTSDMLYKQDLVGDALHTGEHWITVPFEATESYCIMLEDWEEEIEDIYPYEVERLYTEEGWDLYEAFYHVCPDQPSMPTIIKITDIEYQEHVIESGSIFTLPEAEGTHWLNEAVSMGHLPYIEEVDFYSYRPSQDIKIEELHDLIHQYLMVGIN